MFGELKPSKMQGREAKAQAAEESTDVRPISNHSTTVDGTPDIE